MRHCHHDVSVPMSRVVANISMKICGHPTGVPPVDRGHDAMY
jgi:hypothetical protein